MRGFAFRERRVRYQVNGKIEVGSKRMGGDVFPGSAWIAALKMYSMLEPEVDGEALLDIVARGK